jgi:hypothetical protein
MRELILARTAPGAPEIDNDNLANVILNVYGAVT